LTAGGKDARLFGCCLWRSRGAQAKPLRTFGCGRGHRSILFDAVEKEGGAEVEGWALRREVPGALACAHTAKVLYEMRKAYMPALLSYNLSRKCGFPAPAVVENGGPRFQVPKAVEKELLSLNRLSALGNI
jgi:hypothetical protein